jgi:MYXO-CTERM domain-containing protein
MVAEGLTGGSNTTALTTALDALEAAGTDSDGDGTGDIDELRAGEDPNAAGVSNDGPTPSYGFGCAAAPAASPLVGALAAFGLLALRRRR